MKFAEIAEMENVLEFPEEIAGNWKKDFFKNENPLVVELACGAGDYSYNMAKLFPEKNFIGVDIKGNRIWNGAKRGQQDGLTNLGFLRIYIENLQEYFSKGEINELWITFPDPQPRKSKAKKRLTSTRFLSIYKDLLADGAEINFKTDDLPLFDFSVESAKEFGCTIKQELRDIYGTGLVNNHPLLQIKTKYEKMHLEDGRLIYFLKLSF